MERWIGKVAIVTGASLGIGAAITEKLLDAGVTVVGISRRQDKLTALEKALQGKKGGKFYTKVADVKEEKDLLDLFHWTKTNVGPIHILVNNAGTFREKGLLDGDTKDWQDTLDTNVLGLCVATREAVKDMRANNTDGHIINIGSIVTNDRFPNVNVYIASKQAVGALTETLRHELNAVKSKIKVSCIHPGFVHTTPADSINKEMYGILKSAPGLEASDIAEAVIYVLSTPPRVQVHEMTIRPIGEII